MVGDLDSLWGDWVLMIVIVMLMLMLMVLQGWRQLGSSDGLVAVATRPRSHVGWGSGFRRWVSGLWSLYLSFFLRVSWYNFS